MGKLKFIDSTEKKRTGIRIVCVICDKEFVSREDQPRICCSLECSGKYRRNQVLFKCAWCDAITERKASACNKSKSGLYFCCRECKDNAQKIGGIVEIMPPHYGNGVSRYREKYKRLYGVELLR